MVKQCEYGKFCRMTQNNKYGEIKAIFKEALKYFELSSEKGDAEAQYYLGQFIENGYVKPYYGYRLIVDKRKPTDFEEGLQLIEQSCRKGNMSGINTYGYIVEFGIYQNTTIIR